MAVNPFIFLDTNYIEYYNSVTGSFYNTSTIDFLRDNRSDRGFFTFNTTTGGVINFDLGSTQTVSEFMVLNHNFVSGHIRYGNDGAAWTSLTTFLSSTVKTAYFQLTITARWVSFGCNTATATPQVGEFIVSNKKFQLARNPSRYAPRMISVGSQRELYDGKTEWIERSDKFGASIGWDYLVGDMASMTGTDAQNVTELVRQKSSFLFYPNGRTLADGAFPDFYSWRPQDIFKCKILEDTTYNNPLKGSLDILDGDYNLTEVK